ncbi:MAG: NUDIX hydrolase [Intrasporangiaceae bacterium]|nr:NUDIX hydrolase [Intrasporangiaceae bacterium]
MRDFHLKGRRLGDAAVSWLRGEVEPTDPVLASTVMLVRAANTRSGLEVFLQRRVASMEFAPSVVVFPGGRVDPRDARPDVEWVGRSPQEWAEVLGVGEESARLLVTAAIRELFEESGVLLAGPHADEVVADVSSPAWHDRRTRLANHELSLAEVLTENELLLRSDLLGYRAHWVTPEFEPRRYDTRFFAATLPEGQVPDDQTSEVDHADWADPAEVLDALAEGEVLMFPPTQVCLEDLTDAGSLAAAATDFADVPVVTPELMRLDGGELVLRIPLSERGSQ